MGRHMVEIVRREGMNRLEPEDSRFMQFDKEMALLEDNGAKPSFFQLSDRTFVCLIRERDGWETLGFCQTTEPDRVNLYDAKYRALYNALRARREAHGEVVTPRNIIRG